MATGTLMGIGLVMAGVGTTVGVVSALNSAAAYSQMASMQTSIGAMQMMAMQQQGRMALLNAEGQGAMYDAQADMGMWSAEEAELVAEYNEYLAEIEVENIEKTTGYELYSFRRFAEQFMGKQKASYAKAGVEVNTGSPLDVMAENRAHLEMEASEILRAGVESATAAKRGGVQARFEGSSLASRIQAQSAMDRVNAMAVRASGQARYFDATNSGYLTMAGAKLNAYSLNQQSSAMVMQGIGSFFSGMGNLGMSYGHYKGGWGGK